MKHATIFALSLLLMLALAMPAAAHTAVTFSGAIAAGDTAAVVAPFAATVDHVAVKAGDSVNLGDTVATLGTTSVYATESGTVAAIFADVGQDAGAASERFGGAMFIEPTRKYSIYVEDKYAYESVSAMYPHIGDTVYLQCSQDGSHVGVGQITAIDDTAYTVETTAGEFYPGEAVRVYTKARKYAADRIGRGTVVVASPIAVSGTGAVVRCNVAVGDVVEKGQLLFETLTGLDDPAVFPGDVQTAPVAGIVTQVSAASGDSVQAGAVLARICPLTNLCVTASVAEADLAYIAVGDSVELAFETISEDMRLTGTVSWISALADAAAEGETDAAPTYTVRIDFDAQPGMRIGQSVTVYEVT